MKKNIGLILFISLIINTSCNKFLDVSPSGYVLPADEYYKTPQELDYALRGIYFSLRDGYLYGNMMLGRMGLEADEGFCDNVQDYGTLSNYVVNTTDIKLLYNWRGLYIGINRANLLLRSIDNPAISISQIERDHIKGQALFLRGYFYFLLVNKFGGVPLLLSPSQSSANEAMQQPRATTKAVYEQVLSDMEQAVSLVKDIRNVESAGRVSKSAVYGVLARVCLYMAGYPLKDETKYADATAWAKKVIDLNYHKLESSYEQVFINYAQDLYNAEESILEVEFYGNGTGIYNTTGGAVGIVSGIRYFNTNGSYGYSSGFVRPTQWLYDLYETGDLRRDWAIPPYRYVGDVITNWPLGTAAADMYCGKFRREYELLAPKSASQSPQNFPLLRYSDVLLMYAEALNEVNGQPTIDAYEAINKVRRRAWGKPQNDADAAIDITGLNYQTFKTVVKNERAKELCFESLRKNDIVRWGDFYLNMQARLADIPAGNSQAYVSGREYYRSVSQRDTIWPIPSYEMGINKKLVQNQGW